MANAEHVELVKAGKEALESWRKTNPETILDLSRADFSQTTLEPGLDLSEANLRRVQFERATLNGVKFSMAIMEWADLRWVDAKGAQFDHALLERADFHKADLWNASFIGAGLQDANFEDASLALVNFHDAVLLRTRFNDADTSTALNLKL